MHPTHRDRLRHGPEVGALAASVLARLVHLDGEVREGAPEVVERDAVARAAAFEAAVVDLDGAVDGDVVGGCPEPGHLGVVPHLELQRRLGRAVVAGEEVDGLSCGGHLGIAQLIGEGIHGALDLGERGVGAEDLYVRPEVRMQRVDGLRGSGLRGGGRECAGEEREARGACGDAPPPGSRVRMCERNHAGASPLRVCARRAPLRIRWFVPIGLLQDCTESGSALKSAPKDGENLLLAPNARWDGPRRPVPSVNHSLLRLTDRCTAGCTVRCRGRTRARTSGRSGAGSPRHPRSCCRPHR